MKFDYLSMHSIKVFLNVVEKGSFRLAAEALMISQPAVSAHIHRIEEQLCCRLFERTSGTNRRSLTREGQYLYNYAVKLDQLNQTTILSLQQFNSGIAGDVRFALSIGKDRFAALFAEYSELYPNVSLTLRAGNSAYVLDLLKSGEVNFGISQREYSNPFFRFEHLASEPTRFFCAPNHPLANTPNLKLSDLANYNIISCLKDSHYNEMLRKYFYDNNFLFKEKLFVEDGTILLQVVRHSMAIGLLSEGSLYYAFQNGMVKLLSPVDAGTTPHVEFHLVTRRDEPLPAPDKNFLDFARKKINPVIVSQNTPPEFF